MSTQRVVSPLAKTVLWTCFTIIFALPSSILAAGGGGSPGDHGRQNDSSSSGVPWGDLFGDQWALIRDVGMDGDGAPILFDWNWPPELTIEGDLTITLGDLPINYDANSGSCLQPFSYQPISGVALEDQFTYFPYYDSYGTEHTVYLVPLDDECKIPDAYTELWGEDVTEVESGRLNVARSNQYIFDAAYEEALSTINRATAIGLDPAGRLLLMDLIEDDIIIADRKTIDSPLENLALYQRILLDGCLSPTENLSLGQTAELALNTAGLSELVCDLSGATTVTSTDLLRAASFLGGSGDKTGRVDVDLVVYLNNALGLNETTIEHRMGGSVQVVGYYSFGAFQYARDASDLSNRATLLTPPPEGSGLFDAEGYPVQFDVMDVAIMPQVFTQSWDGPVQANGMPIVNFARAADDATAIINYIHNHALPEYPLSPLP
mgnify:CR=1 FL=1